MINFKSELAVYAEAIETFRLEYELPNEWFARPDHVAIKCADSTDYDSMVGEWLPSATHCYYVHLNNRRLGTAKLLSPIAIGNLGTVQWLEIMEPRPEKVGIDPVGVDHMEFDFVGFNAAEEILNAKGVSYERQKNPNQEWLSIMAHGHEFKLSSKPLDDIIAAELASGAATVLK